MIAPLAPVNIGFIPLVDCALLCVAKEKGFAQKEGIELILHKEVSWANIRDKVFLGYLDGAHMLAGMPIAANLSLMPNSSPIVAPFVMGRNGNAITISLDLRKEIEDISGHKIALLDLKAIGAALKQVVEERKAQKKDRLRFAMVFPFSCHNYHLRFWLKACGIDPDEDVQLEVVPPPFMDQFLAQGRIDGFCVGEPWNSIAVDQGVGVIIGATSQIWSECPEKLLGLRKSWALENKELSCGLVRALDHASQWVNNQENMGELAHLLAGPTYLDMPEQIINRSLNGLLRLEYHGELIKIPKFLVLSGEHVNEPDPLEAQWLFEQMQSWKQTSLTDSKLAEVHNSFDQNLYRSAKSFLGTKKIRPSSEFFDGTGLNTPQSTD